MRRGFTLITAIIIMITIATLMTLMITLSTASVKSTTDIYLKEQAELLTRSATEYTLLALSGHNHNQNCLENLHLFYPDATSPSHEANVSIWYIGRDLPSGCGHVLANDVNRSESNLTVIVDVKVWVNRANTGITEPIVIHRRTIQKP